MLSLRSSCRCDIVSVDEYFPTFPKIIFPSSSRSSRRLVGRLGCDVSRTTFNATLDITWRLTHYHSVQHWTSPDVSRTTIQRNTGHHLTSHALPFNGTLTSPADWLNVASGKVQYSWISLLWMIHKNIFRTSSNVCRSSSNTFMPFANIFRSSSSVLMPSSSILNQPAIHNQ